jgi:hypothetical protein
MGAFVASEPDKCTWIEWVKFDDFNVNWDCSDFNSEVTEVTNQEETFRAHYHGFLLFSSTMRAEICTYCFWPLELKHARYRHWQNILYVLLPIHNCGTWLEWAILLSQSVSPRHLRDHSTQSDRDASSTTAINIQPLSLTHTHSLKPTTKVKREVNTSYFCFYSNLVLFTILRSFYKQDLWFRD